MHLVVLHCVLVITGFVGGGEGQASTKIRGPYTRNPPDEYVELTEGDTLTLNCAVLNHWPHRVYWKKINPQPVSLTRGSVLITNDPRVSVNTFLGDNYDTYSMNISNITHEDSGKYICLVNCLGVFADKDLEGHVYVLVRNFPKQQPVCNTNQNEKSTSDSVYLWCDTVKGYPGVNVNWTVDGTGDDEIPNCSVVDYLDGTGRERVRTELRFNSAAWGNHWAKEFVCTVTSSEFPGLKRTCSVNVTVERDVTTKAYFDGNVPSVVDNTMLAISLVIHALFIALFIVLICVLKRKRQKRNLQGRKTKRTTSLIGPSKARGREVVVPYSVTRFQNDNVADISHSANNPGIPISGEEMNVSPQAGELDITYQPYSDTTQQKQAADSGVNFANLSDESYQPAGDVEDRVSPYKVNLDLNGESAVYSQIPDECTTLDIKGQRSSTDYETVQSAHPAERQVDNHGYEVPKVKMNLSRKGGGQTPTKY